MPILRSNLHRPSLRRPSLICGPSVAAGTKRRARSRETEVGFGSNAGPSDVVADQFWMKTAEGDDYGPVDRASLNRWFSEGRVGPGYQIRQGENGPWQPADVFKPQSGNPYSASAPQPTAAAAPTAPYSTNPRAFAKPDPSGLVLTMGILAWVCLIGCGPIGWIPGLIAWIKGKKALADIQAGVADPTNTNLVQVGYYLGMACVILTLLGAILFVGVMAVGIIADL